MVPDFLTELAAESAAGAGGDKKKQVPVVACRKRSKEAKIVDELSGLLREQKTLKTRVEALKSEIVDFATQRRNAVCGKDGRYYSTVKLTGATGNLSVTTRGQYSKIPMTALEEVMEVLEDQKLGDDAFEERFSTRMSIKIDNEALQDPSNHALLEKLLKKNPRLRGMLEVSAYYEPKESWVKTFMFSEQEQVIVDELEERQIMKPYSPTFR